MVRVGVPIKRIGLEGVIIGYSWGLMDVRLGLLGVWVHVQVYHTQRKGMYIKNGIFFIFFYL